MWRRWPKRTCVQQEPPFERCQSFRRTSPASGSLTGQAVAKDDAYIAVATAANRFIVIESTALGRDVQFGERLSLLFRMADHR